MTVTADVTRYATGDVRETCVIPTDPTRTEPDRPYCNYLWSPNTTSSSSVTRGRRAKPAEERFWEKVTITPGCWLWTGYLTDKGYGRIYDGRRLVMVHRFSYELVNSPAPPGFELGHLCHVRNCVNPDHLEPMTHAENVQMSLERRGKTQAMTEAERKRKWWRKKRREELAARQAAEIESGWWVSI